MQRSQKLFMLKLAHTLVFLVQSAAILYILYGALRNRRGRGRSFAIFLVAVESMIYLGNGRTCPMTDMARSWGDATGNDFIADIFLPPRFARLIPPVCGTLAAIGVLLPVLRRSSVKP